MIFEIVIGLIFVYLLFSLICAALSEIVAWLLTLRAKTLRGGIEKLLNDPALTEKLYAHPLIQGLTQGQRLPSYIPKDAFASALLDIVRPGVKTEKNAYAELKAAIAQLPADSALRKQLEALLDDTLLNLQQVRERVEKWFDGAMDRVTGWYKRRAEFIVMLLAAVLVLVANADSVMLVRSLARDSALRASLVAAAEQTVRTGVGETRSQPDAKAALTQLQAIQGQIDELGLPVGWKFTQDSASDALPDVRHLPSGVGGWVGKLLGLLFTVLAVSLGAPFWFDVLSKVVNVRLAGKKPSPDEPEKEGKATAAA